MISQLLGYANTEQFVRPEQFELLPANEVAYALRIAARACEEMSDSDTAVRFDGAYVLSEDNKSASIPVVYVVSADSEADARRLHQFVWNQNQVPFLILESPSTVRLYSGFSYNREADTPLVSVARDAADLLTRLEAFRAEAIDDGSIWKQWAHSIDPQGRVDESLLRDLATLDKRLQQHERMDRGASHGLIGRYVYLNYLRDRKILSDKKLSRWGIDPEQLFSKHATLKAFRRTNDELQDWLNGSVFSLGDDDLSAISADQLKLVARVFAGDSPVGMTDIQAALFSVYDFSHIPIETLSCVYEQFLHDSKDTVGPSRSKALGAYYTPLPLTDYVLSEMERKRPLEPGMKVLDPSCGSGAFLVQCYRRLIERHRRSSGRELKATELRDLLTQHIFGVDRDDDACRVAELSLIMTLLDYIAPPDLESTNFKLPTLRNKNIFQGDFFDTQGAAFEFLAEQSFDWIIGNPPWAEVKGTPSADHEHYVAHQWMLGHSKSHPTSGNQLAEAFLWKAGEHLSEDGVCGLVVLAMTWFKNEAMTFRQRFFSERRVWCLANFANLAYVLFSGSERPASVVFFENAEPADDHTIMTFAPFVAEQIANRPERASKRLMTWNIVVGADELREINQEDATKGDSLTWKLAMWGTSRDRKLLAKLQQRFDCFDAFAERNQLIAHEGFRFQKAGGKYSRPSIHVPELEGQNRVNTVKLRKHRNLLAFPENAIEQIPTNECYVPIGRAELAMKAANPPHILLDAARRFAVYSDQFLAIPAPNISIGAPASAERLLRALSLVLTSKYCVYHQFLNSRQWGVDTSRSELATIRELPVPLENLSESALDELAAFHSHMLAASTESHGIAVEPLEKLIEQLDARVYKLLGLCQTEQWLIEDFVELHMQLKSRQVHPRSLPKAD